MAFGVVAGSEGVEDMWATSWWILLVAGKLIEREMRRENREGAPNDVATPRTERKRESDE